MKKTNRTSYIALSLALAVLLAGCSGPKRPEAGVDEKAQMAQVKAGLKKGSAGSNLLLQLAWLRGADENAALLRAGEPASETAKAFLAKHASALNAVPARVSQLAMQANNLDSFRWAFARGIQPDLQYQGLLQYWSLGPDWRDYFMAEYPEQARSVFMNRAIEEYNITFFNAHVSAFKASGYKVESPQEQTEFNARFCRFLAEQIETAMLRNKRERVEFFIAHMPALNDVKFIDWKTKEVMAALGDYVFLELKDEALACKLVELGYACNRVDLDETGFGAPFADALRADPEYAFAALQLDEWQGTLSAVDAAFLATLPDDVLASMHKLYFGDAIEFCMKQSDTENAMRLIALRQAKEPMTRSENTELMNWSLECGNRAVFDYAMSQAGDIDIYMIDLGALASSQKLFIRYIPEIMANVHNTMDTLPRPDGTTLGRINKIFASKNQSAGLYIVQHYNLSGTWLKATKGRTLLMDVCHGGNLEAARFLIEQRGADVRAETGYSKLQTSLFGRTIPTEGKLSPIFFAAKSGNSALIRYLSSNGGNIHARSNYGTTPLMHAVSEGHIDAVKTLIGLGATVNDRMSNNLTTRNLTPGDVYEKVCTAYRRALANGDEKMLALLKEAGARP
ncbi:ankyrin repeat domain-containing protein [Pontiella sulfatireligans]|uniref:Uncharacterized protein n=1 Tax=Pontiella sulfatireligans TaxID=2750658 RepID=A0A6C2UMU0_9BACT|nr:ankyrin repeat domain-containing protein [Pontiella sulfatireligans]VGO20591.1 hypothetical protein SCARR_02656 [Pontiella sulfatireligans]